MKILYRQNQKNSENAPLTMLNITNCHLKDIQQKRDYKIMTPKCHSHTEYEIHIVFRGSQSYEVNGKTHTVGEREFLIIPPRIRHQSISVSDNMLKYSITFDSSASLLNKVCYGKINKIVFDSIDFILKESENKFLSSYTLIENRIFEMIITILRLSGYKESPAEEIPASENERLTLARKFIDDNIDRPLSTEDIASYCCISTRQLSRLFMSTYGTTPAKYINYKKMQKAAEYVKITSLTFRQISEKLSFNNEFYFNTVFKKHFGMPPMAYRKMFQ